MRVSRPYSSLLFLFLTILSVSATVRADDADPEEYDLKTRDAKAGQCPTSFSLSCQRF